MSLCWTEPGVSHACKYVCETHNPSTLRASDMIELKHDRPVMINKAFHTCRVVTLNMLEEKLGYTLFKTILLQCNYTNK